MQTVNLILKSKTESSEAASNVKTSCLSRGGKNSVIPAICNVPEQNFSHNMLNYQTAYQSIALYDYSDLNM